MTNPSIWDDKAVEALKQLYDDGFSFTQIARRIPGATRNSVAGKLHRLQGYKRKEDRRTA